MAKLWRRTGTWSHSTGCVALRARSSFGGPSTSFGIALTWQRVQISTSTLRFVNFPPLISGLLTHCHKVHVQGYMFARAGPACRISFSTERSPTQVVWSQCTRLTAGTLVVLSPRQDNFKTQCYVAVVAARYLVGGLEPNPDDGEDESTAPRIEIFWSNCQDAILNPAAELVMLEAKGGYFETVRHAMVGLQHAALFE